MSALSRLSRLFGRGARVETRDGLYDLLDGRSPFVGTGNGGNAGQAEQLATTVACVQAIASGLALLPIRVYRANANGRTELRDHPVARLIRRPSRHMDMPSLIEWLMGQVLLWGNGLLAIEADRDGNPIELTPVPWCGVSVSVLPGGDLAFDAPTGRRYLESEVIYLRDRSDDGIVGRARLSRCTEVLTAARSLQTWTSALFENGASPSGILSLPPGIQPDGVKRLEAHFGQKYTGARNARRVMLVDKDTQFTPLASTAEDAEALNSRRFSGEEIARVFGVPPAIIGDLTHGTFTNSETAGRWFGQFTLNPWAVKIQEAFGRALFDPSGTYHLELDMSALQRGNDAERWASYAIAIDKGILDPNEVRELEGWNPRPAAPQDTPGRVSPAA